MCNPTGREYLQTLSPITTSTRLTLLNPHQSSIPLSAFDNNPTIAANSQIDSCEVEGTSSLTREPKGDGHSTADGDIDFRPEACIRSANSTLKNASPVRWSMRGMWAVRRTAAYHCNRYTKSLVMVKMQNSFEFGVYAGERQHVPFVVREVRCGCCSQHV